MGSSLLQSLAQWCWKLLKSLRFETPRPKHPRTLNPLYSQARTGTQALSVSLSLLILRPARDLPRRQEKETRRHLIIIIIVIVIVIVIIINIIVIIIISITINFYYCYCY